MKKTGEENLLMNYFGALFASHILGNTFLDFAEQNMRTWIISSINDPFFKSYCGADYRREHLFTYHSHPRDCSGYIVDGPHDCPPYVDGLMTLEMEERLRSQKGDKGLQDWSQIFELLFPGTSIPSIRKCLDYFKHSMDSIMR